MVRRSALAWLAAFFTVVAGADDSAAGIETVVVTASRYAQPLENVSASLGAVGRTTVDEVRATHPAELLNRIPGTWISRGNGQENLTAIRSPVFTGAGSCGSFYMAADGIPLRPAGFCNVNQLFEANTEQAERIEVLRGPGTAVHGNNALHGIINVISRPPAAWGSSALSVEGGPHDYARLRASHSAGLGPGGTLRLDANAAHDGGYKDDSGFDQQKLTLRHDWRSENPRATTVLAATNLNQETAGYLEGKDAYKDSSRRRDNPDPEAFRDNTAVRLYSRWTLYRANGQWRITPHARHQRMDFLQHFLPGTPLEQNGVDSVGMQLSRIWRGRATTVSAGLDVDFTEAFLQQGKGQPVGFSPLFPVGEHYDYSVDTRHTALWAQGEWQADTANLVNAGVRVARQHYEYENHMPSGSTAADGSPCVAGGNPVPCRYSRPDDRSDEFDDYALNLGWVHTLDTRQRLLLRLAHGFRAPEASELYRLQAGQQSADLDSEGISSIEIGWRWQHRDVEADVVAFAMRKSDVIYQDSRRRNVSAGRTSHRGIEAGLGWQLTPAWRIGLEFSQALHRYEEAEDDIEGNIIDTAPRHMGGAQVQWTPDTRTRAELEWVHMGSYWLDADNEHRYAGHDLLNLRLRRQVNENISVGLRLVNATDRDYAERADYAFGEYRYFVGEPRSLYADLSLRF